MGNERGSVFIVVILFTFLSITFFLFLLEKFLSQREMVDVQWGRLQAKYGAEAGVSILREKIKENSDSISSFSFQWEGGEGEVTIIDTDSDVLKANVFMEWPPQYRQTVYVEVYMPENKIIHWHENR
ncbi:hypothetical protein L1765_09535 [Microaerobacter geothermalis]|uniref:hypothetical protein n=1 Tax=Microaerobacter geothermalis TaxID=674972 RepID=UPI001F205E80|nr:hypothetical protein [Microaerobacter geothermalis]MCF6094205.1 hypothetical protein [Microaerobacter geothermalis]